MTWINSLSTLQFLIFLVVIFLTLVQLTLFARAAKLGSPASFIPAFLAIAGGVYLFSVTH